MNEVVAPFRKKIDALQSVMARMPQATDLVTAHYFADGMYCRAVGRKEGTLIIGKVHKREHFYIVARGAVQVTDGFGIAVHEAGDVIVSRPGTKRAVLALVDSICLTVHRTDKTDPAEIERELLEDDPTALFDARNEQRSLP